MTVRRERIFTSHLLPRESPIGVQEVKVALFESRAGGNKATARLGARLRGTPG